MTETHDEGEMPMTEPLNPPMKRTDGQLDMEMQIPDHAIRRFAKFLLGKLQADPEAIPPVDGSNEG